MEFQDLEIDDLFYIAKELESGLANIYTKINEKEASCSGGKKQINPDEKVVEDCGENDVFIQLLNS